MVVDGSGRGPIPRVRRPLARMACIIGAPASRSGIVPHGDVMRVLETFLGLGMSDVVLVGEAR